MIDIERLRADMEAKTTDFHWVGETLMAKEFGEVIELCSVDWSGLDEFEAEHKRRIARLSDLEQDYLDLHAEKQELAMQVLASSGQAQEAYEAQKKAEAERDALRKQNLKLRGALAFWVTYHTQTPEGLESLAAYDDAVTATYAALAEGGGGMISNTPDIWIMHTRSGYFYPIVPFTKCKPEDHGELNPHVVKITDQSGTVLWRRQ